MSWLTNKNVNLDSEHKSKDYYLALCKSYIENEPFSVYLVGYSTIEKEALKSMLRKFEGVKWKFVDKPGPGTVDFLIYNDPYDISYIPTQKEQITLKVSGTMFTFCKVFGNYFRRL
jgi:hypothetical protein